MAISVLDTFTPCNCGKKTMLTVSNLIKNYSSPQGAIEVLKGLSFDMAPGETIALMGESGCGKSTLLHVIAGLDVINSGSIKVGGIEVSSLDDAGSAGLRRTTISLVFQQFNLITSLSVAENLAFEARLAGRFDPEWTKELAERLDLKQVLDRYPEQLSGGQQQRVAIGRSFAAKPGLVLADEPTGNLDETNSDIVLDIAFDLLARTGASLLMATHSTRLAARADRILRLSGGVLT